MLSREISSLPFANMCVRHSFGQSSEPIVGRLVKVAVSETRVLKDEDSIKSKYILQTLLPKHDTESQPQKCRSRCNCQNPGMGPVDGWILLPQAMR